MTDGIEISAPNRPHDHDRCMDTAIAQAEALCAERNVRLTDIRRTVLELVWENHRPAKAYDILDRLSATQRNAKPPTVYRALEFLMEQGLIHRIESLNAYVGCSHATEGHASQFLICDGCETVIEMDSGPIQALVRQEALAHKFRVTRQTVEVHGLCQSCRDH